MQRKLVQHFDFQLEHHQAESPVEANAKFVGETLIAMNTGFVVA